MKRKEKRRSKKNKVQSAPVQQQTSRNAQPSGMNGYPQYPYPPYPPMYPTPYPMNQAPYPMYPGQMGQPYQQPPMCYGPMGNGINPCAMPSRFIQLTPIVQPIAMVPYSTQRQPLAMYDGFGGTGMEYGEDYGYEGYSGMDYINGNEEDL